MRYDDCEMRSNGDGVKPIYQQREQRNKLALKNLKTGMKGKMGKLSNLQIFNFEVDSFASGTGTYVNQSYNTSSSFPANATDCVMFGSTGINGKALYYNVLDVKAQLNNSSTGEVQLEADSIISFYILQNINGSTTSLGTKIPQPSALHGTSSGTVIFKTSGHVFGHQSIAIDFISDSVIIPANTKGLRCSGLALRQIYLSFASSETLADLRIDVEVLVDVSSVSSSY
jgi:hypothetical protein